MKRHPTLHTVLAGAALLAGAVLLAGCSNSTNATVASTTTTTAAPAVTSTTAGTAACTHDAILTAAQADASLGTVASVVNVGCAGSWAYANVTVGTGSAAFDAVIVLQAQGSGWVVADRANACNNHLVPAAIYTQACTTS